MTVLISFCFEAQSPVSRHGHKCKASSFATLQKPKDLCQNEQGFFFKCLEQWMQRGKNCQNCFVFCFVKTAQTILVKQEGCRKFCTITI